MVRPPPVTNVFTFLVMESTNGLAWQTNRILNTFTNPPGLAGMKLWGFKTVVTNL